jgi:hypothetical protein
MDAWPIPVSIEIVRRAAKKKQRYTEKESTPLSAGSGSGILRLRRIIRLLFGEKNLKTVCFNRVYFKPGS